MYKIDEHVTSVVAGLTADANILINNARVTAQRYIYTYDESMPVSQGKRGFVHFDQKKTACAHAFSSQIRRSPGGAACAKNVQL